MSDERVVDEHLVQVLNQVLDALYQAKQVSWSATGWAVQDELQGLVAFLIQESGRLMIAEERIDGRSPELSSPSAHQKGNLVGDVEGDLDAAITVLARQLSGLVQDVRRRVSAMPDVAETQLLVELADQLDEHVRRLTSP